MVHVQFPFFFVLHPSLMYEIRYIKTIFVKRNEEKGNSEATKLEARGHSARLACCWSSPSGWRVTPRSHLHKPSNYKMCSCRRLRWMATSLVLVVIYHDGNRWESQERQANKRKERERLDIFSETFPTSTSRYPKLISHPWDVQRPPPSLAPSLSKVVE